MIKKQPNINFGAAILFVIFSLLFFVLLYRFISIQLTGEAGGEALVVKAQQKYDKERTIEAKRGTIYDRNGEVIATDTNSYKLIAILDKKMTTNKKNPQHVDNPDKTARELAKVIDMEESEIYRLLKKINPKTNEPPFQVEFGKAGRDLSNQKKREIDELELPGITFIKDTKRFYPNGVFASHLVGFVEKKETEDNKTETVGMLGIEQTFNDVLTGKNGKVNYESDIWGYLLADSKEKITPAEDGKDIYLTIDKKIQTFLEDSMSEVDEKYKPKKMIAVVADPKTGEILAMSQRPSFHPKTKEGISDTWHNEAVENSFEPGSTMKIFTLAAAIEDGVFNPNELYKSGRYAVDSKSKLIGDHNYGKGWGTISYYEGVLRSSNVAFAKLVKEKIGYESFREYLSKFKLDQPTGIELPNEAAGKIQYEWPRDKVTTGFGQASAITPIQQVQGATAIANGGQMVKPLVISKIVNPNKKDSVKKTEPEVVGNPISAKTAKEVRDILKDVVSSPKGTGNKLYQIDGYEVSGKTGTAQIPKPGGGYLTGHQNLFFSFIGMAPTNDPELIVYVAVEQPQIDFNTNGAKPVAEIFKPVMKSSLQYLNIEPEVKAKAQYEKIPSVIGSSTEEAKNILSKKGINPVVMGKGKKVIDQLPEKGTKLITGENVVLLTDKVRTIPDMTGWSLRDVMKIAKLGNLELNSVGNGYVVKQNLKPGSIFKEGDYLIVELDLPSKKYMKAEEEEKEEKVDEGDETESQGDNVDIQD